MALYVYGLMRSADAPEELARGEAEVVLPDVRAITHDGICALVSDAGGTTVRLGRQNLLAHAEVLRRAHEHGPVLPLRFGTVIANEATLTRDLLATQAGELAARLDGLAGKAEFQLKASYLEAPLLAGILAANPALAKAAHRVKRLPAAATHFERIRLGELVAQAVQAKRENDARELIDELAPHAVAVSVGDPMHEQMALNAAFLVDTHQSAGFDEAVERASRERAGSMGFRLVGPLPAYSFADREEALAWA